MKFLSLKLVFAIILISGCGTTKVLTNHPDTAIYINNELKGKGEVEIKRMGPPKKINISAKYQGKDVGSREAKREFDFGTLILGLYTYGLGLVVGWRYPKEIFVPIDIPSYYVLPEFQETQSSPWMKPPRVWGSQ